jgi:hypothetical protein
MTWHIDKQVNVGSYLSLMHTMGNSSHFLIPKELIANWCNYRGYFCVFFFFSFFFLGGGGGGGGGVVWVA